MKVMLAEDIGGGLLTGGLTFGAIIATVMGILAALPARKGNRFAATVLATPGILVAISSTLVFGYTAIVGHRQTSEVEGAAIFWLLTALPPLIVSGLVMLAAWSPNK